MILDTLDRHAIYATLHPRFASAFAYLRETNFAELGEGKHLIDGDNLFAIVARTMGKHPDTAYLEFHRQYIDIQYIVSGPDMMGWKPLAECKAIRQPYESSNDLGFFDDRPVTWCEVPNGCFTIFFPSDAHAPLAISQPITKVVVKVAV